MSNTCPRLLHNFSRCDLLHRITSVHLCSFIVSITWRPLVCLSQWSRLVTLPLRVVQRQVFKEQLHTRVVLVAVEIWTDKDHIPISVRPLEMLRDFSKYRQQSIKHHADAVHLISWVLYLTSVCFCRPLMNLLFHRELSFFPRHNLLRHLGFLWYFVSILSVVAASQ